MPRVERKTATPMNACARRIVDERPRPAKLKLEAIAGRRLEAIDVGYRRMRIPPKKNMVLGDPPHGPLRGCVCAMARQIHRRSTIIVGFLHITAFLAWESRIDKTFVFVDFHDFFLCSSMSSTGSVGVQRRHRFGRSPIESDAKSTPETALISPSSKPLT